MGYEFDIFLSYRRSGLGTAGRWVRQHFYPLLLDAYADECGGNLSVFIDLGVEAGDHWPSRLESALSRSRLMVTVWSPPYFESPWCDAEWRTMCAREQAVGLAGPCRPHGLIYPVVYSDGDYFPREAQERQARSVKPWSYPREGYRESRDYDNLFDAVRLMAREIRDQLKAVPPWESGWPVVRPPAARPAPAEFPVLKEFP